MMRGLSVVSRLMRSDWLWVVVTAPPLNGMGNPGGPSAPNPATFWPFRYSPDRRFLEFRRVIDANAALVPWRTGATGIGDVVFDRVAEGVAGVGGQHVGGAERDEARGHAAEPVLRNRVVGEQVADVAGAARGEPGAGRIVDGGHDAAASPATEVARVVRSGRNGQSLDVAAGAIAESLVSGEEERLVLAVVDLRDIDRAANGAAEIALLENRGLVGKEAAGVHGVVAQFFEQIAVHGVGARLGGKRDRSGGAAEFGLHPVGFHGEFTDGIDGHGGEGRTRILIQAWKRC